MSNRSDLRLRTAVREMREHIEINGNPDAGDHDAIENLLDECGMQGDGDCLNAGSEYCDWECPFRNE
jgi:hypothetical protein